MPPGKLSSEFASGRKLEIWIKTTRRSSSNKVPNDKQ